MGGGPIFAQALKAVNPLSRGFDGRKKVERHHQFCYNPAVFEPGNGLGDSPRVGL